MGKVRDGRGSEDPPPVEKRKMLRAGKVGTNRGGGSGGSFGKPKALESREESDSESAGYLASLRRRKAGVDGCPRVNCSDAGGSSVSRSPDNCMGTGAGVRRVLRSDSGRFRRDDRNGLKRDAQVGVGRERIQEVPLEGEDDEITLKEIKVYFLARRRDKKGDTDAKRFDLDSVRRGIGEASNGASGLPGPKQETTDDESLSEKRMRVHLERDVGLEAEGTNCSEHASLKMHRVPKCRRSSSNEVLPSNRKFGDQDGICVKRGSEKSRKSPRHSVSTVSADWSTLNHSSSSDDIKPLKKPDLFSITDETRKSTGSSGVTGESTSPHRSLSVGRNTLKKRGSSSFASSMSSPGRYGPTDKGTLNHPSLPKERSSLKKSADSMSRKSHKRPRNVSSAEEIKGLEVKKMLANLSPEMDSENADDAYNKFEDKKRMPRRFIRKALSSQNNKTSENVSRSTKKQKLRDHIKNMLLNAGWKIDMRPRRGRNYEDSVYISPQGTGYWSITKAYGVLEEQFNKRDETGNMKGRELYGQQSKASSVSINGAANQFSAIPLDLLAILKKKVVKKRRRRIDEDTRVPLEKGSGSKKAKYTTSFKSAKIKEKVVVVKKAINGNCIGGSSRRKNKIPRGQALLARTTKQGADSEGNNYVPYAGKRSVLAWLIDSGCVPVNGKVKYMNKRRTRAMLEGIITGDGICCNCCSKVITVSKFEIHAGSKMNQPYANIFLTGPNVSLLQCQLDSWKKQEDCQRCAFHLIGATNDDPNDDTCGICGDGGNLICCDSCPSTFHLSCLGIQMLPPGEWRCANCLCRFCGSADGNTAEGNCTIGSSLLSCGQCGRKFHQVCILEVDATSVDSNSSSLPFCGQSCRMLFEQLQNLLGVKNELEAGFSWTLVHRFDDDSLASSSKLAQWAECNSKIAVAFTVMDECFQPFTDPRSGLNVIKNVIYNCGSNFIRLNYSGFYTFILERGDEMLSVASIRIHGTRFAEMPFIGTREIYRRQGMCRRLLNAIEVALGSLKIGKLVIPAISELMHTWTEVFGFKPLDDLDKQEIKNMNLLVFPGTGLLHKSLLRQGNSTLMEGGATSVLVPNGSSSLHASDNDIFSCSTDARDEIENIKPSFAAASNSMHVTPEVSCQPSDASCNGPFGSCTDASRYKFLETALDEVCSVQDDMSHHDEPRGRSILCANNSIEPENQLSCEGAACNVVEGQVPETGTHPSGHRLLIQESPDGFGKSLDVPSDIPDFSEPVVHAKSWSAGNLSELKSEESCDHTLEVINENTTSSVLLSPASGVSTMRDVCGREDEVSVPADSIPNFDSHQAPEAVSASLKAMAGIISTDTLETNLHELVDDALHVMQ